MTGSSDYFLYGVSLHSQFPLPYAENSCKGLTQVSVERSRVPLCRRLKSSKRSDWFREEKLPQGDTYLAWQNLFEFLISRDGRTIAGRPLRRSSPEAFNAYLLGQVLSFALLKQGLESLHSSAVAVDGGAIGFLGDCGQGKSTLLASFLSVGHRQITDDLLVLHKKHEKLLAYPGPPRIKLMPASVGVLGGSVTGSPMNDLVQKMIVPLSKDQWQSSPVPMRVLYLLSTGGRGLRISISQLPKRVAMIELIRNAFNIAVLETSRLERQFVWAEQVANAIPVRRISYPRLLSALPAVRTAILRDLAENQ